MSALLDAALRYASRGWPALPCRPRGKVPCTKHGLKDATRDRGLIEAWWAQWSDANVAVRTGRVSGLVVLDVDGDDGTTSLRTLGRAHGPLPRTATVVTPRGGQHFYFAHPGVPVPSSAGKLGIGLDVRGEGGYVIAPPSIGTGGRRYEPDERAPIAPMPAWLLERLPDRNGDGRERMPASEWLGMLRNGVPEGQRNDHLARFVGHLLRRYVSVDLVAELTHLVNVHRCQPPLPRDEVDRIIDSIAEREANRREGR